MTTFSALRKLAKEIDPSVKVIHSDVSEYDDEENAIYLAVENDGEEMGFLRHLREVHNCKFARDFPFCLWTLLHEMGHHFTADEEYDEDEDTAVRLVCACVPYEEACNDTALQDLYYNLPSEYMATEWAIGFVSANFAHLRHLFGKK